MKKVTKIVILTGSELRHTFFRKWIASSAFARPIEVLQTFCEGTERSIGAIVQKEQNNALRTKHLRAREQSEEDFFRLFVESTPDRSRPIFLPKGEINSPDQVETVRAGNPDLLIAYGCSIIKDPLLEAFAGRFINIHLGLSPYYRGSGTNFWPLVNCQPEYAGATFMHMDAGVDSGEVIHQIRARVAPGDSAVQIGNRLIVDMARVCRDLVLHYDELPRMPQIPASTSNRYYKKRDYTEDSVAQLYANFANGMIDDYLKSEHVRREAVPIVCNPALGSDG